MVSTHDVVDLEYLTVIGMPFSSLIHSFEVTFLEMVLIRLKLWFFLLMFLKVSFFLFLVFYLLQRTCVLSLHNPIPSAPNSMAFLGYRKHSLEV